MKALKATRAAAVVAAALLCAAASARAQAPAASPSPAAEPDLSLTAHVTARELRFTKVPNPTVEFPGRPERATVWEADRENLPREVRPGVTYRNVGVRLRITSVFADIDRIVAEALGEVPASDATPESAPPPGAASPHAPAAAAPSHNASSPAEAPARKARTRFRGGTRR